MTRTRALSIICFVLAAASLAAGMFALAGDDRSTLAATAAGVVVFGVAGLILGGRE